MTRMDRWRNEEVKRRFSVGEKISERVDWTDLMWLRLLEYMGEERLIN